MSDWRFVAEAVVLAVHDSQVARHGGVDGIRDPAALAAAVARPRSLVAYGDATALAASYAFGIARAHAFVDGNKRTAWVVARLFLADNGCRLGFGRAEAVEAMVRLAAGEMSEADFAGWLRAVLG